MSHVVLARKYRPRSFDQMVGQEHVVQALGNALSSGRLHHAYLFTGTRGIGKTTVSRILAKSLNCTGPDGSGGVTAQPCGQCMACTEIDADRYIDYIELDAASNRSIDEIRDLIERAAYKPSVGRFKVFMIDEAHQLTKDAFNALLKTLEEPPDYLKFVLATTDPEKMLPTVLSRCLQFNLRPMPPEVVHAHLQAVLQAEDVPVDAGSLRLLSRAARGSMRDALSLTDQAIAYGAGQLQEAGVRTMLGSVDRQHAARLVQALAVRDGAAVLATVNELRSHGLSAAGTLEEMAGLLQQMAVEQAVPGALDDTDPDTAGARQLAGELPADETQLLYSIVLHGRAELSLVSDDYAALTMVLLRLLAFPPAGPAPVGAGTRAAPLQAAPREARLSTVARPVVAPPPKALPASHPPLPRPAAAVVPPSPPKPVPAPPPQSQPKDELPPWLDDALPDEAEASGESAAPAEPAASSPPPPGIVVVTTPLGDRWAELLRPVLAGGSIVALVRELALQAELVAVEQRDGNSIWRLRVERESLRTAALRDKLQAALQAAAEPTLRLELEAGVAADSLARRDAAEREAAQREAEQLIQGDPAVCALMAQFRTARIVPGSIKPVSEPRTPLP
ncbi:DNA polymerase III subunit gamma/tau [Aquabacterium sp.]|uniref:DNA polymerase III subunit gamma/tau n=1 Tax=Aquabacterium sp. TaxID=1872578 RepID=UPI002CDA4262|nr:DNA polymerase III subunit gamma/tau [Aquabacterium sp.]HSW07682.1 DNA polymerase III subunit gamma/tau [Aquabacterium sp.]